MGETKECTLMFYFASDNPLAISIVSQLKAIKSAGHHPEANVIVQYDPVTEGTPTHIFDVNLIKKIKSNGNSRGYSKKDDPFPESLIEDRLWLHEKTRDGDKSIREAIAEVVPGYRPPPPPNGQGENGSEPSPNKSLTKFLEFCAKYYPARHYMLFILGHGVIVGNDVFLFDENAEEPTLKLDDLRQRLEDFKGATKEYGTFDLVAFHSCSVSSLEVAYELQGTADYMLASQGTAFVGSWPYKQIIDEVVSEIKPDKQLSDIKGLLLKIFDYCLRNSADFLLAGYPFDLCLWNLNKITSIKEPFGRLSQALIKGLDDPLCRDLVILAHWQSQSFFQEMYTDLYDFCFCLGRKIQELFPSADGRSEILRELLAACEGMNTVLEQETAAKNGRLIGGEERLIVRSEFAGPEYQYAHGISLYFPWSQTPAVGRTLHEYTGYKISAAKNFVEETRWLDFLNKYLSKTMRKTRTEEQPVPAERKKDPQQKKKHDLHEDMISLIYTQEGPRNGQNALDQRAKTDPTDPTGGDCNCPSIKNYPSDMRRMEERRTQAPKTVTFSPTFYPESSA